MEDQLVGKNATEQPPSGQPHVWAFWAAVIVAAIGAATAVTTSIQKSHSEDKRQDLETSVQALEAQHAKDEALEAQHAKDDERIASLTSDLAAARAACGKGEPAAPSRASAPAPAPNRVSCDKSFMMSSRKCELSVSEEGINWCWAAGQDVNGCFSIPWRDVAKWRPYPSSFEGYGLDLTAEDAGASGSFHFRRSALTTVCEALNKYASTKCSLGHCPCTSDY